MKQYYVRIEELKWILEYHTDSYADALEYYDLRMNDGITKKTIELYKDEKKVK